MRGVVVFLTVFLSVITLEVAARAYYDAVVVESRGGDEDLPSVEDQSGTFNPNTDCFLPKQEGPCRAFLPSFYYSAETGRCEGFVYSGCGGNKNNFNTREVCERKCRGVSIKRKGQRPEDCIPVGDSCEARGCRTAPKTEWIGNSCKPCICPPVTAVAQSACRQPPAARGHCRALLPRWSYDQQSKSCREFQFGGCDGNRNNFPSKEACLRICDGI